MELDKLTLNDFSPRGRNLVASLFGGGNVRVVLSERLANAATVILESRTLVFDPNQVGLYDLALCALLVMRCRGLHKAGPKNPLLRDRWLTRQAHRRLIPQVQEELQKRHPGILQLPGRYVPGCDFDGLRVVVKSAEWRPLTAMWQTTPLSPLVQPIAQTISLEDIPAIEITGADNDFQCLMEALTNGRLRLSTLQGFEELPFLRIPFRLNVSESCPTMEVFEHILSDPDNKKIIRSLIDCYQRKSEVRQERRSGGSHLRRGVNLDTNRLVQAVLAPRVGMEPRIFRRRATTIEPIFDPAEHLVVIAFDINDLRRQVDWLEGDAREAVQRFLLCMIGTYQKLGVDCVIVGFADQLVTLPGGGNVCLHLSTTVKAIDDAWDDALWNRVCRLLNKPPELPGTACCFHPLALQDIVSAFDRAEKDIEHSYRTIVWWARRGMPHDLPEYRTDDFLIRTADCIDSEMFAFEQRLDGTLDTVGSFLPSELKNHGRPGRYLSGISIY